MIRLRVFPALAVAWLLALAPLAAPQTKPAATPSTTPLSKEAKAEIIKKMSEFITERAFVPGVDFDRWTEIVFKHQPDLDAAEDADSFNVAMNKTLREFGVSHINLISPRAMEVRVKRQGIGIGVGILPMKNGILVTRTVADGPAAKAGIVPGDLLVEADGKKIEGPEGLRGDEGTKLKLKVQREDGSVKEFEIVRRKFDTTMPEQLTWPTADTAVLKVSTFDISYNSKRVEGLMNEAQKAKQLIVDLRGNGGGVVMNVLHMLGMILPDDAEIGTFLNRRIAKDWMEKGGDVKDLKGMAEFAKAKLQTREGKVPVFKGKVAVLIDGGSGSGSEIAAAALRDVIQAPVIGEKSAGAVLASVIVPVGSGFSLLYPVFDYVTIRGERLEGQGVVPDATAPTPAYVPKGKKDPGIENAMALLAKASKDGQK